MKTFRIIYYDNDLKQIADTFADENLLMNKLTALKQLGFEVMGFYETNER